MCGRQRVDKALNTVIFEFDHTRGLVGTVATASFLGMLSTCLLIIVVSAWIVKMLVRYTNTIYIVMFVPAMLLVVHSLDGPNQKWLSVTRELSLLLISTQSEEYNSPKHSLEVLRVAAKFDGSVARLEIFGRVVTTYDMVTTVIFIGFVQLLSYVGLEMPGLG